MISHNASEVTDLQRHRLRVYQPSLVIPQSMKATALPDALFFRCRECQEVLPVYRFPRQKKTFFGIQETCQGCRSNRLREHKKETKEASKECVTCEQIKPTREFQKDINTPDGRMASCRSCHLHRTREYRKKLLNDPERIAAYRRKQTIRTAFHHGIDVPDNNIKTCSSCKEPKILEDFYKSRSSPDGHASHCIACQKKRNSTARDPREVARYRRDRSEKLAEELGIPLPTHDIKRCSNCRKALPLHEFHKSPSSPDEKNSQCVSCRRRLKR